VKQRRYPPWLLPLLACAVLSQAALNLSRPLVTYRVIGLGGDALAVGLVTAAFAVLPLVVAMPLGRLTDRLRGLSLVLACGPLLLAGGALLMSTTGTVLALAFSSAVLGLGQLVFMVGAQAIVARWSPDNLLDRGFGWFTAAVAFGQLFGPLIAGGLLGDASGAQLAEASRTAFWVAAGLALLPMPLVGLIAVRTRSLRGAKSERPATVSIESSRQLVRRPGVGAGMYASLALLSTVDILTAYLPLIGERSGISPAAVGVLLALRSAATIFSRLLLDRMLRRWTRQQLIVLSAAGSAIALAVVPVSGVGFAGMGAALLAGGFLLGVGQPLTMSVLARAVPDNARSSVLALRMVANRMGQVAVPSVAGVVAASAGAAGAWWLSCVVLGTAALVSRRSAPPQEG
jgi:MFS family permease